MITTAAHAQPFIICSHCQHWTVRTVPTCCCDCHPAASTEGASDDHRA